nr:hypothetical protein [Tanacetum cinerariifolium]
MEILLEPTSNKLMVGILKMEVKGYTQEERIDYDEVFALVARIKVIRLFLAYTSFKDFVVYQMDVKSAFLYGKIEEKASTQMKSSKPLLKDENSKDVDVYLHRSMIGSLMYLTSSRPNIMFGYPKDSRFDMEAYTDSDYAGGSLDKKSTTRGCKFLKNRLISWQCKKKTIVANSTTKADRLYKNDDCNEVKQLLKMEFRLTLATAKVKHVNIEAQLHAKVDGKRVVISKASIRSDIRFGDAGEVVVDEAVYVEMYDSVERAATTATGLDTNQALQIRSLKRRVKKLEKKASKRTHKLKRSYKIGSSGRIESSDEASLGDQEDASKQEMIIDNLDADKGVTLVDETQGRNDQDMFDIGVLDDEVVAKKEVSTADPVTTASEIVITVAVKVSTTAATPIIFMDDITLAKALAALKSAKPMVKEPSVPKAKEIIIQEPEETTIRTITTVRSQGSKDKGKVKMIEPAKSLKKKDQIMIDEEVTRNLKAQLQAELEELDKLMYTNKKDRAEGSETRAKGSSKRLREELESDKSKKKKLDEQVEVEEDNDQEEVEMKMYMKILSDDEIGLDAIPLATKPLIIVDWKIIKEGKISSYHIIRHDGSSKRFLSMI